MTGTGTGAETGDTLLAVEGLTKAYPGVIANDGVSFAVRRGEVHALLGENGAGKSTLVKTIYGLVRPDTGRMIFAGRPYEPASPSAARAAGVAMVFQHFSLFEEMTVAENVAVALPERPFEAVRKELAEVSKGYGLALEPDRAVWTLSAGERQRIEIVRCLLQKPRLLVLDEPTSVLTPQESERLFETLTRLSEEGTAILYISHKLEEVRRLCRAATILRGGKVVATLDPRAKSARDIAALMVGTEVGEVRAHLSRGTGEEVLRVESLSLPPEALHGKALADVALTVRAGEIVGVAGVAGNGQSELFAALSGERLAPNAGDIVVAGTGAGRLGIDARRRLGAAFVPEERLGHAAAPSHALSENTVLSHHATSGLVKAGFVAFEAAGRLARSVIGHFDVRAPAGDPAARKLSGGNLQKFVVGREILRGPKLLVVDQPTWGVDAGAARLIRQALVDLAAKGAGVLVISQDLDELFEIADRMAVISDGRLSRLRPVSEWSREAIGLEMMGVAGTETAQGAPGHPEREGA